MKYTTQRRVRAHTLLCTKAILQHLLQQTKNTNPHSRLPLLVHPINCHLPTPVLSFPPFVTLYLSSKQNAAKKMFLLQQHIRAEPCSESLIPHSGAACGGAAAMHALAHVVPARPAHLSSMIQRHDLLAAATTHLSMLPGHAASRTIRKCSQSADADSRCVFAEAGAAVQALNKCSSVPCCAPTPPTSSPSNHHQQLDNCCSAGMMYCLRELAR